MPWTFEETQAGYSNLWRSATLKGGADAQNADLFADKIIAAEQRYRAVQAATGVPWYFIGALHMREASNNFDGVLHNGERIIGTGRLTTLVPANRGPFNSWEESAIDALKLKGMHRVQAWSAARMLYDAEVFNGLGYVGKGINSPYVWAGTNHEQRGKYVADHVFSYTAEDTQLGVAAVLIRLAQMRPDIHADLYPADTTAPTPQETPMPETEAPQPSAPIPDLTNVGIDPKKMQDVLQVAMVAMMVIQMMQGKQVQIPTNMLPPAQPIPEPPVQPAPQPVPTPEPPNRGPDLWAKILGFLGLIGSAVGAGTGVAPITGTEAGTIAPVVAGTSLFTLAGGILGIFNPTLGSVVKAVGGALTGARQAFNNPATK